MRTVSALVLMLLFKKYRKVYFMDTIKIIDRKQAKIIAHRGGSLELENTIGAFISSANRSFFGIETDIHVTIDGRFIVYHDDNTSRLLTENLIVEETDYETLRNLKFRPYRNRTERIDIKMPCLEEYIDICKYYNKTCILEIKNTFKKEDLKKVCDIYKEYGYLDNVIFIAFYIENLLHIKELYPEANVQFLVDANEEGLYKRLSARGLDLHVQETKSVQTLMLDFLQSHGIDLDVWDQSTDQNLIDECHKRGMKVNVFTVNTPEEAQKFIDMGADFITSDCLE